MDNSIAVESDVQYPITIAIRDSLGFQPDMTANFITIPKNIKYTRIYNVFGNYISVFCVAERLGYEIGHAMYSSIKLVNCVGILEKNASVNEVIILNEIKVYIYNKTTDSKIHEKPFKKFLSKICNLE